MGSGQSRDPKDTVVLITGCSEGGIGHALAEEFHARGCTVFASARRLSAMQVLAARGASTLEMDVTEPDTVKKAVSAAISQSKKIDILVNNAGISQLGPLAELPLSTFSSVLNTNLVGPLAVAQAVFPHMARQRDGTIVNVSSTAGTFHLPFWGAYGTSKAALDFLTSTMRVEMAPFGIRVVLLKPGFVQTPIIEKAHGSAVGNFKTDGLYAPCEKASQETFLQYSKEAMDLKKFSKAVVDASLKKQPKWRYIINFPNFWLSHLPIWMQDSAFMAPYAKFLPPPRS